MAAAGAVESDRGRAVELPGPPLGARAGAAGDDDLLQFAGVQRARKRDGGDLSPPQGRSQAPLPGVGGDAVPLHPEPVRGAAAGHAGVGGAAAGGAGKRRPAGAQLVAVGHFGPAAVPAGAGRRDLHADLALPRDAGGAHVAAACAAGRRHGRAAVGGHAARADLVFLDAVAGEHRLRLAHHGDRGVAEPGNRRHAGADRGPGDRELRTPDRTGSTKLPASEISEGPIESLRPDESPRR